MIGFKFLVLRSLRLSSGRTYFLESPGYRGIWRGPVLRSHKIPRLGQGIGPGIHLIKEDCLDDWMKPLPFGAGIPAPFLFAHPSIYLVLVKLRLIRGLNGNVVEHSLGYRASHAIIDTIFVGPGTRYGIKQQLERRYKCEVMEDPRLAITEAVKLPKKWRAHA